MPGSTRLSQRLQFLLLVWRQRLINFRHRRASDRRKLTKLATFGSRQLLDLPSVIGLNRRPQRLARLMQLLPKRLRGLSRLLEDRFRLSMLGRRQIKTR